LQEYGDFGEFFITRSGEKIVKFASFQSEAKKEKKDD
jgi:hypothetical protein